MSDALKVMAGDIIRLFGPYVLFLAIGAGLILGAMNLPDWLLAVITALVVATALALAFILWYASAAERARRAK